MTTETKPTISLDVSAPEPRKLKREYDETDLFLFGFSTIPELEWVLGVDGTTSVQEDFEFGDETYTVKRIFDHEENMVRKIDIAVNRKESPPLHAERIIIDVGRISSDTDPITISYKPFGVQRKSQDRRGLLELITPTTNTPEAIGGIRGFLRASLLMGVRLRHSALANL